jgi:hypothetical protein
LKRLCVTGRMCEFETLCVYTHNGLRFEADGSDALLSPHFFEESHSWYSHT